MAGHRLSRGPCPRCGRDCAISPVDGVPVRHKNGEQWCNGEPKRSVEIVGEILQSLDAERLMLRQITDAWLEAGEMLVRMTGEVNDQRTITVDLLRQGGAAVRAELAKLQESKP